MKSLSEVKPYTIGDNESSIKMVTGKLILANHGIEAVKQLCAKIKRSKIKAIMFPNGPTDTVLRRVVFPTKLDTLEKKVVFRAIINFKY